MLTTRDRLWQKLAATFISRLSKCTSICAVTGTFVCGVPIFVWVRNVVAVITGSYIYGVLILCGCLLSRFYGTFFFFVRCIFFVWYVHLWYVFVFLLKLYSKLYKTHKLYTMLVWLPSNQGQGSSLNTLNLCSSLVPRLLPDFISRLWRKFGNLGVA